MSELAVILPPPEGTSLVGGIQHALGEAITQGKLPPGYRLREIPLAKHFRCSTTPVREALRRLEHEGLVTLHARRGAEVISIDQGALENLYETRLLLECHAARRAAETNRPADEFKPLHQLLDRSETLLDSDDFVAVNNLDIDFHTALSDLSGNHVIAELVKRVLRQIEVVRVRTHSRIPSGPKIAYRYHGLILAAVQNGDGDQAAALMREHINWSDEAVRTSLEPEPSQPPT